MLGTKRTRVHTHKHTEKFSSIAAKYLHIHFYRDDFLESGLCAIHFDSPEARQIDKKNEVYIYIYLRFEAELEGSWPNPSHHELWIWRCLCAFYPNSASVNNLVYNIPAHAHKHFRCNLQCPNSWMTPNQPCQTNNSWITLRVFMIYIYFLSILFSPGFLFVNSFWGSKAQLSFCSPMLYSLLLWALNLLTEC